MTNPSQLLPEYKEPRYVPHGGRCHEWDPMPTEFSDYHFPRSHRHDLIDNPDQHIKLTLAAWFEALQKEMADFKVQHEKAFQAEITMYRTAFSSVMVEFRTRVDDAKYTLKIAQEELDRTASKSKNTLNRELADMKERINILWLASGAPLPGEECVD